MIRRSERLYVGGSELKISLKQLTHLKEVVLVPTLLELLRKRAELMGMSALALASFRLIPLKYHSVAATDLVTPYYGPIKRTVQMRF
jgi:hypothetical protein